MMEVIAKTSTKEDDKEEEVEGPFGKWSLLSPNTRWCWGVFCASLSLMVSCPCWVQGRVCTLTFGPQWN